MSSKLKQFQEDWEKEFDERFIREGLVNVAGEVVKSFIRQLLIQEKQKLLEEIEILARETLSFIDLHPECDIPKVGEKFLEEIKKFGDKK